MDGVLAPTEPFSCKAFRLAVKEVTQLDIGNQFDEIIGLSLPDAIQKISLKFDVPIPFDQMKKISERKETIYFHIAKGQLKQTNGLRELLSWLDNEGIGYCLAFSGTIEKIQFTLRELGLEKVFHGKYFSSSQVRKGKPFPDLFNFAAMQMGWSREKVIVIEDSPIGIMAAVRAGMTAVGLRSSFSHDILQNAGATITIGDFKELISIEY